MHPSDPHLLREDIAHALRDINGRLPDEARRELERWVEKMERQIEQLEERDERPS